MESVLTIRPVLKGERVTAPATDSIGWVRRAVPADGICIEGPELCVFIRADEIMSALGELEERAAKRRKRR